jgi:ribosomal protein S27E
MTRYEAEKQHRMSIRCSGCGKWREVGLYYARKVSDGKIPDLCRRCADAAKNAGAMRPGEFRVRGRNNKWVYVTATNCPTCGRYQLMTRRSIRKKTCKHCKGTALDPTTPKKKWPKGQPHPVRVKTRSTKVVYRCHGLWNPECPRYDQCLDDVIEMGWDHFVCSHPGPKHHDKVLATKDLRELLEWYDTQCNDHDMFDGSAMGINPHRRNQS